LAQATSKNYAIANGVKIVSTQKANPLETVNFTFEIILENGLCKIIFFEMLPLKNCFKKECHYFL